MAFGMKHWIGLTALGLLLVSIWKLPPSALEPRDREFVLPEVARAEALGRDVERTHGLITHMRWSDSLSALTVQTAVEGLAIGFPENSDEADREWLGLRGGLVELAEDKKDALRQRIREELAALEPRADVDFGYYFQLADQGTDKRLASSARGSSTYVGERDGQAYCIQVFADSWFDERDLERSVLRFTNQKTNAAGICRPYLKYGVPGQYVGEWMEDGGTSFALAVTVPDDPTWEDYHPARRTFFGLNLYGFSSPSVDVDRCLAGITEACAAAVTDRGLIGRQSRTRQYLMERTPLIGPAVNSWSSPFGALDDYLLDDLETEFGPERFQRFWTSDQELLEAFQAAFGVDLGTWVLSWVEASIETSPPGPKLSKSAALGGMLALSIFAAFAGAWARRRRLN